LTFSSLGNLGRLGNQMFQYAALRGISDKNRYDYFIPDYNLEFYKIFKIPTKFGNSNSVKIEPLGFEFDENLYSKCPNNVDLCGYFQSEKYFKNVSDILRKEYTFSDEIYKLCYHYLKTYGDNEIISLHVRRGDYLQETNFVNLNLKYYYSSLKILPKRKVLVFTDDIEWCKMNFNSPQFIVVETNNKVIDLCLMTICNYHIIANSSFSWWGSWLSKSKKTISPSQWFQNDYSSLNTKDLYLPNWIVI